MGWVTDGGAHPEARPGASHRRAHECGGGGCRGMVGGHPGSPVRGVQVRRERDLARAWWLLRQTTAPAVGVQVQPRPEAPRPVRLVLLLQRGVVTQDWEAGRRMKVRDVIRLL